jgi:hypothetical protein
MEHGLESVPIGYATLDFPGDPVEHFYSHSIDFAFHMVFNAEVEVGFSVAFGLETADFVFDARGFANIETLRCVYEVSIRRRRLWSLPRD